MSNQPIALENLFDADFYRANNPDLRNFNNRRALEHWRNNGQAEGRMFSPLVDINFYRTSNSDLSQLNNRQLLDHLANFGINEGRVFSPFVNINFYRAKNPDLASFNNRQLFDHLASSGVNEGRAFSPLVDFNFYRAKNRDLANLSNRQLFDHLTSSGVNEGRAFSPFVDFKFYNDSNPDLVGNNRQRFNQLLSSGLNEGRAFSPFIDLNFYRASNPDLANLSNRQLFNHLMDWGINEGRTFSPYLDLNFYRASHRDLASFNNRQLWEHFINYGFAERRSSSPIPYNTTTGYGLVNASAAVAAAIGQSPFPDVPNIRLGHFNSGELNQINAPEAWSRGYTGQGVVVAVIDGGVDYRHVDLDNNIWVNTREIPDNGLDDDGNGYVDDVRGWNFVHNNNDPMDFFIHGTHVAGIIAGENNGVGPTGVAFNAKIMPIKVYHAFDVVTEDNIAAGIRYAVDNGADVINLSLAGDITYPKAVQAIRYAVEKGAVVVMAAGNDRDRMPEYPARYATHFGIAVGAVNGINNLTDFSNRAGTTRLDYVTAPGFSVYSTSPNNGYYVASGTSMATPHVSGIASLILSANPNLSPVQVERIITANANTRSGFSLANSTNQTQGVEALSASFDSVTGDLIEPENNNFSSSDRLPHASVFDAGETAIPTESFANASTTLPFNSIPIDAGMTQNNTRGALFFEPNSLDAMSPILAQIQPNIGTYLLPIFAG